MTRRVVVTGIGGVCATGANVTEFWESLQNGVCGISRRTIAPAEGYSITAPIAPIDGFEERVPGLGKEMTRADRFTQLAIAAADEAFADSGYEIDEKKSPRVAAIIGTGIGGQTTIDEGYVDMFERGRRPHPAAILKFMPNAPSSHIAIRYGARGPGFAISSACASGAHAIGVCADIIRFGGADAGFAGASEAVLTYGSLNTWRSMHILSDDLCRPFSKSRRGLVIGEGSGVLFLEEYEHARARGANIHAEIVGFCMNADGKDMINPDLKGAATAMRGAIAGLEINDPSAVYINAHGTGTLMNDPTETRAIRETFGADADSLIVSSTKSMHGHLLGAAGGIEAVASILALKHGVAPPTINLDEPDPACDLDYASDGARERKFEYALSNSFAFGGLNAVLAFRRI